MESHEGMQHGARPDPAQARAALGELGRDGAALAARIVTPWWYHPSLGAITALFAGAQALPGVGPIVAVVCGIIAIPILTTTYARRYGVVTTKPAGPRSKRLMLATLVILLAAMASGLVIKVAGAEPLWALLPAAIAFVTTVMLGRRYDDALRREIAGPRP